MGKIVQCVKVGHHYDKSANPNGCPHCQEIEMPNIKQPHGKQDDDEDDPTEDAFGPDSKAAKKDIYEDEDLTTVAVWRRKSHVDPVVGWLVCIEGENQGRDYRIMSGRNTIGRAASCRIPVRGDDSISRENHAFIFYHPKKAAFYIAYGEGLSGVEVNEDLVLQPTLLKAYDKVQIGESIFVFVPLCTPDPGTFRWDAKSIGDEGKTGKKEPGNLNRSHGPDYDDKSVG